MKRNSVLVVDDEPIVRESIRDWLMDAGYHVDTAASGEEALELVARQDFSVMVMDIRMPGKTGLAVLREVKAERPWIKSIIITAYPSSSTMEEARRLGAVDYLIKPVVPDDLERIIRETIESAGREPTIVTEVRPRASAVDAFEAKKHLFITGQELRSLVQGISREMEVIGVRQKQGKYFFDRITNFDKMCLDYDVTMMPPTKFLLPERETFLKYRVGTDTSAELVIEASQRMLVGVHPYDIKAIELLDEAFMDDKPDPNYIARRHNTIIIGVDCLNPSPLSFSPSMGTHVTETGFDLMLTDIGSGYLVTVGSRKGAELLVRYTEARDPTGDEIATQKAVRDRTLARYRTALTVPREKLPKLLEDAYDDPYWETRSKTCLSCGSCVMVCPTCFCFDVHDEMALNMQEGERFRHWDGCVLQDFARVATGENFRHDAASRYRHRIYRKGKYIVERYGRSGCVGCGRCASACLAEIASPLDAFNAIAEAAGLKEAALRLMKRDVKPQADHYAPRFAELIRTEQLTAKEKLLEFRFREGNKLGHQPGQFVEMSALGIGEAPISISSSPTRGGTFQLAIRNVGDVTNSLHRLEPGALVGVRGPFGNGFPVKFLEGKDLLLIAGGIGLFPLRSLIQYVLDQRSQFGKVALLCGTRSPAERLFLDELALWAKNPDLEFHETVDRGDETWKGNVGVITTLIPRVQFQPAKTVAVVVGPPIMYRFAIVELKKKDLADENVIVSLERRMKCGLGKCGHCQINGVYVCKDGPVFSLAQLRKMREAV